MTTLCACQSYRAGCLFARAGDALAHWWAEYTVLHNRSLVEEAIRSRKAILDMRRKAA